MDKPRKRPRSRISGYRSIRSLGIPSLSVALLALFSAAAYGQNDRAFIFSGGIHVGGITKTEGLDAVSGASKTCGHGSVHLELDVAGHFLETGLDYSYLEKELDYSDTEAGIDGTRSFTAHGISMPILYNVHFLKRAKGDPKLVLGIGLAGYYFPYLDIEETGTVSGSDAKSWAAGPCVRIAYFPCAVGDKYRPGVYLHFFRSINRFYTVDYEDADAGELAVMGLGVSLKLKP